MLCRIFDSDFNSLACGKKKTRGQQGGEAGLERMIALIQAGLDEVELNADALAGIGVGSPGPLDLERGIMVDTPNMPWSDLPIRGALKEAFGCPVEILNDVDAGTYGEYRFGAAKGSRCVLGVFPGTGIGGGCVYEGRILRGKTYNRMEIGHIQVQPDGPLCGCGQRGCLEALASRLAISSAAAVAAFRGEAPHLLEAAGMNLANIRSGVLAASIEAGDKTVERIVREAARWLGVAIGSFVNLLGPDTVVLGGGLVEAMPDLILKEAERSAREHTMKTFRKTFTVKAAALGDDATARGAAAWVMDAAT